MSKITKIKEIPVLVTTSHRGVFFGYIDEKKIQEQILSLRAARNCLYWPSEQKGFMGLASQGPVAGCRIGPAVDIELRDITFVGRCSEAATEAWEKAPWNR